MTYNRAMRNIFGEDGNVKSKETEERRKSHKLRSMTVTAQSMKKFDGGSP